MTNKVFNGNIFIIDEDNAEPMSTMTTMLDVSQDFLLKENNLSDIPNRNTARENLGITTSLEPPFRPQKNDLWIDLNT